MMEGRGGNIGLCVGGDGTFIIDDQFAPLSDKIITAIGTVTGKPVQFVINTHFHGDHTGGNAEFGKSATIIAHDNVRKRLREGTRVRDQENKPASREALPVDTFNDRAVIHVNGEEIRALHIPSGHTDGDSVIFFTAANVVHMGDDFVTTGFPFVDVGNGGSLKGLISGIEKVLGMTKADTKFIPGHGALSTRADLEKYLAMLKDCRALVAQAVKEGKSLEAIKQGGVLGKYADLGKGFVKTESWIDVLHADVSRP